MDSARKPLVDVSYAPLNLEKVRKKGKGLKQPRFWLLLVIIPGGAGTVSWFLGGNEIWVGGTVVGLVLLALMGLTLYGLLTNPEFNTRRGFYDLLFCTECLCGWVFVATLLSWWVVGFFFPLNSIRVRTHHDEEVLTCKTRIWYRSHTVAEFDTATPHTFSLRGRYEASLLRVEALGPDGWNSLPFDHYGTEVVVKPPRTIALYIDNRNGVATTIACGQLEFEVMANSKEQRMLPAPVYDDSVTVSLNDKRIGTLEGNCALIDVRGTHSYVSKEITYGMHGLFLPGRNQERHEEFYQDAHLHPLPEKVDYFLEHAPEKITVTTLSGLPLNETRRQLLAID